MRLGAIKFWGAAVVGLASAVSVSADTIDATYGVSLAQGVNAVTTIASYNGTTDLFTWTRNPTYNAVSNNWGGTGDTLDPKRAGPAFHTFCIQLNEFVGNGVFNTQLLSSAPTLQGNATDQAVRALLIQSLWARHIAAGIADADGVAAFQTAVWELVYETDKNNVSGVWGTGEFVLDTTAGTAHFASANSANQTTANSWLSDAFTDVYTHLFTNNDGLGQFADVWAMVGPQDQIFLTTAQAPEPAPLPATASAAFALLGLVGGGGALRRYRRKASV